MIFKIEKRANGSFWHYLNDVRISNISDFDCVYDQTYQTFIIQCKNGSNVPKNSVKINDVILNVSGVNEFFADVYTLEARLRAINYTPYAISGSGGGAVNSVNGLDGDVVLNGSNILATNPSTLAQEPIDDILEIFPENLADKVDKITGKGLSEENYTSTEKSKLASITEIFTTALKTAYDSAVTWVTTNGTNVLNHLTSTTNPHNVTKTQVGLGNVDNTSDLNKPISTATQNALGLKLDKSTTPSSVYTTDAGGLQVMKPISEFGLTQKTITTSRTALATDNGRLIKIKGNATYTIDQATLPTEWNVIVRSFTGATCTFVASVGTTFDAPTGLILKPLKMCSIIKDSDDNKILINGETSLT